MPCVPSLKRIGVVVLLVCAYGCGDGGASIPIDELNARVIDALCAYEVRCGWMPDKAACDETIYSRQQLVADVKSGKVIYDGKAAAACLDIYPTLGCKVSEAGPASVSAAQACRDAVKGTVAIGDACLTNEECLSEACDRSACTGDRECCAGTCIARPGPGDGCLANGARCADDLFCKESGNGAAGVCTAPIADGQPCTSSDICVAGRRCIVAPGASAGTCGVLPARGAACEGTMSCDTSTDLCDPTSKTCVARVPVGGDCAAFPSGCVLYANCDAATKKCVARKRAGEACAALSDCLPGVACTGGICVAPPDVPACM